MKLNKIYEDAYKAVICQNINNNVDEDFINTTIEQLENINIHGFQRPKIRVKNLATSCVVSCIFHCMTYDVDCEILVEKDTNGKSKYFLTYLDSGYEHVQHESLDSVIAQMKNYILENCRDYKDHPTIVYWYSTVSQHKELNKASELDEPAMIAKIKEYFAQNWPIYQIRKNGDWVEYTNLKKLIDYVHNADQDVYFYDDFVTFETYSAMDLF